ncbi:malonyl-CoA:anthocyanidin 5-O-glucoside-6''-O-malonyltransferase-like [Ziziphus jujuba]|uniref:Malonyl-CoA:anthocyanidin 5-O-glucoside-6''-O-malonyltransferase-like n=1 Tax=Ziziphus jujuba TaxID=326968 RepID=A0A6P4ATL9_ZIZJJ|nr:malonyl-CoA:anthocyanidin 5-O-glucoside-6''-O-malonyltransferase-like [Ziziphus jujuba]
MDSKTHQKLSFNSLIFHVKMAQSSQQVKIIEVCRIAPPPELPGSSAPKSLPLTFFDILWLRLPPPQSIFFYEISSPSHELFYDSIIPKLKHSLSLTLHHFLPLAGNLTWPQNSHKPILNYVDGDGVSLTIAESNSDFYHLSGNDFRKATDYHPLLSYLEISKERATVMSLQVTVFPNCGISIGFTSHHAVLDGRTFATFVKFWARTCKSGAESPPWIPELIPFYDRSVIEDPCGAEEIYLNGWLNHGGPNNRSIMPLEQQVPPNSVRGTFELSREQIEKLKKSMFVNIIDEAKHGVHVSTFSVICGYTWVCLAKALKIKEKEAMLVFSADCRSRLIPSLPTTYFGNCLEGRSLVVETQVLLGEYGVSFAVEAIGKAVKGLEDGVVNGGLETWISMTRGMQSNQRTFSVASSPRLELYNTDFGWGNPRKSEVISIDRTGAICLSDSRSGNGGIEIGVVMKMEEMETFASLFSQAVEML